MAYSYINSDVDLKDALASCTDQAPEDRVACWLDIASGWAGEGRALIQQASAFAVGQNAAAAGAALAARPVLRALAEAASRVVAAVTFSLVKQARAAGALRTWVASARKTSVLLAAADASDPKIAALTRRASTNTQTVLTAHALPFMDQSLAMVTIVRQLAGLVAQGAATDAATAQVALTGWQRTLSQWQTFISGSSIFDDIYDFFFGGGAGRVLIKIGLFVGGGLLLWNFLSGAASRAGRGRSNV